MYKKATNKGGKGHDVHGHGHVGRNGQDGKAAGDPHKGAAMEQALFAAEGNEGETATPGMGAGPAAPAAPQG